MKGTYDLIKHIGAMFLVLILFVDIARAESLLIDVGTTGGNVAINNVVGQSFKVSSPVQLTKISIWIRPESYYITSYHIELHYGEGPGGIFIDSTPIISVNPLDPPLYLGVPPGVPAYYDFQFAYPITLEANQAYTFVLKSDLTYNGPNGYTNYSGAFTENGNVYPDGIEYWLGYHEEPYHDMTFRVYGNPSNHPPTVDADAAEVIVSEGQTATNTGTYSDADTGDNVGLTASAGTLTKSGTNEGTWNWSFATADGPADSQTVTITAEDGNGGTATTSFELTVNNVAPQVGPITVDQTVVPVGTTVNVSAVFSDPGTADTHTATCDWGDGTINSIGPVTSPAMDSHAYTAAGIYTVATAVTDNDGGEGQAMYQYIVVYDPADGFVTGGGWIMSPEGAYKPDPSLAGKANFGFVSKYKKGTTEPTGQTEFVFQTADLNFHSSSYDWLVVNGSDYAMFKGWGSVNGYEGYRFMIWARDTPDTFRIKIWEEYEGGVEEVIYDNGVDQPIDGGSIVIHGG